MIAYLLKTIICSALLLVVYFMFLEKEKIHRFNRFYLLVSVIISFTAPLITVTTQADVSDIIVEQQRPIVSYIESSRQYLTDESSTEFVSTIEPTIDNVAITEVENVKQTNTIRAVLPNILVILYVSVSLFMLLRFAISLTKIRRKVIKNRSVTYSKAQLILTNDKLVPHSFFRYIFIDESDYQSSAIETEILNHELVHITQRHTLDIIFIELLLIVAWINPFILLYKMAIKLNHEFLADQGVVCKTTDTKKYQLLLLNKASLVSSLPLTSSFNYLITKKRLIMITKKTTLRVAIIKQMATIPLMLISLFVFSTKVTAQKAQTNEPKSEQVKQITTGVSQELMNEFKAIIDNYINSDNWKKRNTDNISDEHTIRLFEIYRAMSKEQKDAQEIVVMAPLKKIAPKVPTQKQLESFKDPKIYGLWIDGKRVKNEVLNDYKYTDFSHFSQSGLCNNAKKGVAYEFQVDLMTNAYFQKFAKETKIDKLPNIGFKTAINKVVSKNKKQNVKQESADGVSEELIIEYQAIISKYKVGVKNWKLNMHKKISDAELDRMLAIYTKMSKEQQEQQEVTVRAPLDKVKAKSPTQEQIEAWKDSKTYGLWIDGKRVKNEVLNNYTNTDFSGFFQSRLLKNAYDYGKYKYHVGLKTNAYFQKYAKETDIDKKPSIAFRVVKNKKQNVKQESSEEVSKELLDEFQAIIAKYKSDDFNWQEKMQENITDNELNKLLVIYKSMSKEQQSAQELILCPPTKPVISKVPSVEDFEKWKNAKVYAVWINNERVENKVLNKFKNTDFVSSGPRVLTRNAQKYNGYVFEVSLDTHDYYKKHLAECKNNPIYKRPNILFKMRTGNISHVNSNKLQTEYDKIIGSLNIPDEQLKEEFSKKITVDQLNELANVYYLMTEEQKSKQKVCLLPTYKNLRKKTPTALQLKEWLKKDIYGVWIDEKRVDNNTLAKLKESDFSFVFITKLDEGSLDFGKYKTKIDLMTNNFFEKLNRENEVRDPKIHYRFAFNN